MKNAIDTKYRGYAADIRYSEETGLLMGHVAGIRAIVSFYGESVSEIRKAFEEAVDYYLETEPNPEIPFSGRIMIRVTPETHVRLFSKAKRAGADSLDAWLARELEESVLNRA